MIYLQDNPMLEVPLRPEHIKPRLLGHWGTVPGINLMYAGLNRLILETDANVLLVTGVGHGAPANLADLWIDGCLEDVRPELTRDGEGLGRLIRSFSWPGGFPSHLAPVVPGTIHEGGELGYALATAFGAAFDNPDLIVACIIGDGEAETGPTAGAWHSNKFLDPAESGAVLPILHVNGYKISNPTIFGTMSDEELLYLFTGYGYQVIFVQGGEQGDLDAQLYGALERAYHEIRRIQRAARVGNRIEKPAWPMIILRSPKGWTGIKELDGQPIEGSFRSHQVPVADAKTNPEHLQLLEQWLRSYHVAELFDEQGSPTAEILQQCPAGDRRMGSNPHTIGGSLRRPLDLPDIHEFAVEGKQSKDFQRGGLDVSSVEQVGKYLAEVIRRNPHIFRIFSPDE